MTNELPRNEVRAQLRRQYSRPVIDCFDAFTSLSEPERFA